MQAKSIVFSSYLLIVTFMGCSSSIQNTKSDPKELHALSREDAQIRKSQISNVSYKLNIDLYPQRETFAVKTQIQFDWRDSGNDLRIDYARGKILSVLINGKEWPLRIGEFYFKIPKQFLKIGMNNLEIFSESTYQNDGSGLTKSLDNEDQSYYLHSQLEPFEAHLIFPCFDQPDIKATYEQIIKAPADWKIISYARENSLKKIDEHRNEWNFPRSAVFSTYLWSLFAGPFHEIKGPQVDSGIPLRLFVRKTLAQYVDSKFWFEITQQGFEFFQSYFSTAYPYTKYDQVIVPDFNAGAMENVAAVSFSERFIRRGKATNAEKRDLTNTILHELAHMWFGNLVTMKWWNDLWLNEAFATYMASLAMSRNTRFKGSESWRDFASTKAWAYYEDSLITTHPIEAPIPTTSEAFSNFDGITYGKGASWVKQLHFAIGDSTFKKGLAYYFTKHKESNTELSDFLTSLSKYAQRELNEWALPWLQDSGVDTLNIQSICENNKLKEIQINVSKASSSKMQREHKALLSMWKLESQKLVKKFQMPFNIKDERIILKAPVQFCPDFIDPNESDHGYFHVNLEEKHRDLFIKNPMIVSDPFLRLKIWDYLWNDLLHQRIRLSQLANPILKALSQEKDLLILEQLDMMLSGRDPLSSSVAFYWPKDDLKIDTQNPWSSFMSFYNEVSLILWDRFTKIPQNSELSKTLLAAFLNNTRTPLWEKILTLLEKRETLDQDFRWKALGTLAQTRYAKIGELIEKEALLDPSYLGKQAKIGVEALSLEPNFRISKVQDFWLNETSRINSERSFSQLRAAMRKLFPATQEHARDDWSEIYFGNLKELIVKKEGNFLRSYSLLGPTGCQAKHRDAYEDFLRKHQDKSPPLLTKCLRQRFQEGERCEKIRAAFRANEIRL